MSKKVFLAVLCLFAMSTVAQAAIPSDWVNQIRPMMGTWKNITLDNCTDNITWDISHDKWYVSDSGSSQIAYGKKIPGNVEFILFWGSYIPGVKNQYHYLEAKWDTITKVEDLPGATELNKYTVIIPTGAEATDNFTDNFTCFTKSTIGPYPIKRGSRSDNDSICDFDNCTIGGDNCTLKKIIPAKIGKLIAFMQPIMPFIVIANEDVPFEKGDKVYFDSEAITKLFQIKVGKKIIIAFTLLRPGKFEAGEVTVTVKNCTNTIELK